MDVRTLKKEETEAAAQLLWEAHERVAAPRGVLPPWRSVSATVEVVAMIREGEPEGAVVAERNGRIVGVGFVRRRGEVATLGPLAASEDRRGIGSAVLDELITRADAWGCQAIRLYQPGWQPDSFALFSGRSFAVVDVVARIERPPSSPPRMDAARGLEIAPFRAQDLGELAALDLRLTGLERPRDLAERTRLVARRRGVIVGFLGARGPLLGPAVALDVADLGGLVLRALGETDGAASALFSTAAPTAMLAALGLGFRVVETGFVMSRGVQPPARPPQIYSLFPEIL